MLQSVGGEGFNDSLITSVMKYHLQYALVLGGFRKTFKFGGCVERSKSLNMRKCVCTLVRLGPIGKLALPVSESGASSGDVKGLRVRDVRMLLDTPLLRFDSFDLASYGSQAGRFQQLAWEVALRNIAGMERQNSNHLIVWGSI